MQIKALAWGQVAQTELLSLLSAQFTVRVIVRQVRESISQRRILMLKEGTLTQGNDAGGVSKTGQSHDQSGDGFGIREIEG